MSPTSTQGNGGMSPQDHPDITGLLTGDASPRERRALREHVDACAKCREEFVDLAVLLGEVRDAVRHQPSDPADVPPPRHVLVTGRPDPALVRDGSVRHHGSRRRSSRLIAALVACIVLAGAGFGIGSLIQDGGETSTRVALTAVGSSPSPAAGSASMTVSGGKQVMRVSVSGLLRPDARDHYEVWLLDTRTGAVYDMGTMPRSTEAEAAFAAPADVVARYNSIDVSLQRPTDGNEHSSLSALRGSLT